MTFKVRSYFAPFLCLLALVGGRAIAAPDPDESTVISSHAQVSAGGLAQITVTLLESDGETPVPGKTVSLSSNHGSDTIYAVASEVSGSQGEVKFMVSSTYSSSTYTAVDVTDSITVTQTVTVEFLDPEPTPGPGDCYLEDPECVDEDFDEPDPMTTPEPTPSIDPDPTCQSSCEESLQCEPNDLGCLDAVTECVNQCNEAVLCSSENFTCQAQNRELRIRAAAMGEDFSVALTSEGTVLTWGSNLRKQLGDNTRNDRTAPGLVQVPGGGPLTGVTKIAAGYHHAAAIGEDGVVFAWGRCANGELGRGQTGDLLDDSNDGGTAMPVTKMSDSSPLSGMTDVSCGADFCVALSNNGEVWAWGGNAAGQLGDGSTTTRNRAVKATKFIIGVGNDVLPAMSRIAAGRSHVLAIQSGVGRLWGWGANGMRQVSASADLPLQNSYNRAVTIGARSLPGSLVGAIDIAAGATHSVAIIRLAGGLDTVWTWGETGTGATGIANPPAATREPGRIIFEGRYLQAQEISATFWTTYIRRSDGSVWAFGENNRGQIGDGTTTTRQIPTRVLSAANTNFPGFGNVLGRGSCGFHMLATDENQRFFGWGDNLSDQLAFHSQGEARAVFPTRITLP